MLINTDVELGPLPPTRVLARHLPTGIALHGYNAEDMRAYGAQERAAERERWAAPVRAMVAAHDAGMVRLNTAMRAQGVDRITLPAEAADELGAIQALRDLVGPND